MPVSTLNLASLFLDKVHSRPQEIALRHKQLGIWREWTWLDVASKVEQYLATLKQLPIPFKQYNAIRCVVLNAPSLDFFALCIALQHSNITLQFIEFDVNQLSSIAQLLTHIQPDLLFVDDLKLLEDLKGVDQLHLLERNTPRNLKPVIVYLEDHRLNPIQLDHCYPILDQINALAEPSLSLQDNPIPQQYMTTDHGLKLNDTDNQKPVAFVYHKIKDQQYLHASYPLDVLLHQAEKLINNHQLESDEQAFISPHSVHQDVVHTVWISGLIKGFCLNIPEQDYSVDQDRALIAPTLMLDSISSYMQMRKSVLQKLPSLDNWIFKIAPKLKYWHSQEIDKPSTRQLNVIEKILNALFQQAILATLGLSHLGHAIVIDKFHSDQTTQFYQDLGINLVSWSTQSDWHRGDWHFEPTSALSLSTLHEDSIQGDSHVIAEYL